MFHRVLLPVRALDARFDISQGSEHHQVLFVYTIDFLSTSSVIQRDLAGVERCLYWLCFYRAFQEGSIDRVFHSRYAFSVEMVLALECAALAAHVAVSNLVVQSLPLGIVVLLDTVR